jgi:hypothetical protein
MSHCPVRIIGRQTAMETVIAVKTMIEKITVLPLAQTGDTQ